MHINFMKNVKEQVIAFDNKYQVLDTTKKTALLVSTFFSKYAEFINEGIKSSVKNSIKILKVNGQDCYAIFEKYFCKKKVFLNPIMQKMIDSQDGDSLKRLLKYDVFSQKDWDQALIYAISKAKSFTSTELALELIQAKTFSSLIASEAIIQAISQENFSIFSALLEQTSMKPEKFQEACFRAASRGRTAYLSKLLEYGDIDKEVFKQAFAISNESQRHDLLLFAKIPQ